MLSSIYYDAGNSQLLPPCQQPNRRPYGKASYIPSKRLKNIIRIIIKFYSIKGILQLEESSTWEQVSSCLSYFSFYFSSFHFLIFFFSRFNVFSHGEWSDFREFWVSDQSFHQSFGGKLTNTIYAFHIGS